MKFYILFFNSKSLEPLYTYSVSQLGLAPFQVLSGPTRPVIAMVDGPGWHLVAKPLPCEVLEVLENPLPCTSPLSSAPVLLSGSVIPL